jgi:hypothetical protein
MTAAEIQAPTTVPCGAGTLTFTEDSHVTVEGMDASATVAIRRKAGSRRSQSWIGWICGGRTTLAVSIASSFNHSRMVNSFGRAFTINFRHAFNVSTKLRYGFRVRASPLGSVSTTETLLRECPEAMEDSLRRSLCE